MRLIDLIYPANKIISIVGSFKNAGKTVTLNEIISQAGEKSIPLALISTGRDGEKRDVLTETEKPAVYVNKGTIIATVEKHKSRIWESNLYVTDHNTHGQGIGRVMETKDRNIRPYSARTIRKCARICWAWCELFYLSMAPLIAGIWWHPIYQTVTVWQQEILAGLKIWL